MSLTKGSESSAVFTCKLGMVIASMVTASQAIGSEGERDERGVRLCVR